MRNQVVRRIGVLAAACALLTGSVTAGSFALGADTTVSAAPANDDWASAADVSSLAVPPYDVSLPGASVGGTTAGATREAGEPDAGGAAALGSVWYRYTAPAGSRLGQLGYRVTDRAAFAVSAYVPYVQVADPIPYQEDGVVALSNMRRVTTTGYDAYGVLPGDTAGGFLPAVRVEPGTTVWFQVTANPAATPPTDGSFTFELFAVDDGRERIGNSSADFSGGCQDPFGCQVTFWGDTSAVSPAPIGTASNWSTVQVVPGTRLIITARSIDSHWRGSTRPIRVSVYTHPSNLPIGGVTDVSQLGNPGNSSAGGVELVDGADYGLPGTSVSQWVARVEVSFAVTAYHIRVEGDPTFAAVTVAIQGPATVPPTATITAPVDGAAYASPNDVPALAYACTAGSSPIASEAVRVDGVAVAASDPLPNAPGTHSVTVECSDQSGAVAMASSTYTVAPGVTVPDQTLTVAEDSSVTRDLLAAVSTAPGESATLIGVGAAAHGSVTTAGSSVTYTPAPNYSGSDQFTYTVRSSAGLVRTATAIVAVTPVNDPPVAVDDAGNVRAGGAIDLQFGTLLANDSDIDGDPLSIASLAIVAPSAGGQLTPCVPARPTCRQYVAPTTSGVEYVDYVVSDGRGGTDTGRLRITVLPARLPDRLLIELTCASGWSYTVGGPTTGLTVARGPFGITLISGRARSGAADVQIGAAALRGGVGFGAVRITDPTLPFAIGLNIRQLSNPLGNLWISTGTWSRPAGNGASERCTFQVNVTDGG